MPADGEQVGGIYDGVGVRARLEGWPGSRSKVKSGKVLSINRKVCQESKG